MTPGWRTEALLTLEQEEFDLLIIGGGATGAGIALDAITRGLTVALVDKGDFASGTSSRSTKLLHGGVRYLEKAIADRNRKQMHLVRSALKERGAVLRLAPHLAHNLPILLPLYHWWELPYYWTGLKVYDWLAGEESIAPSEFRPAREVIQQFPGLKLQGLIGGVVYWDGQFDDARLNLELILEGKRRGASPCNYLEVTQLLPSQAEVRDRFTGKTVNIRAKQIVNATGPWTDQIRHQMDPEVADLLQVSAGAHIVVDRQVETGVVIPKTPDNRVLFLLPWEGKLLIGTTDTASALSDNPVPTEEEIAYLIEQANGYLDDPINREEIRSAWSGLRPLVRGEATETASLVRDHLIHEDRSGMITVTGGKWTTYRQMAEECIDRVMEKLGREGECITETLQLPPPPDFGEGTPLHPDYPYTEEQVLYAIAEEMVCTEEDLLARRIRLDFLDHSAADSLRSRIAALLLEHQPGMISNNRMHP